jgi:hypothetical protein
MAIAKFARNDDEKKAEVGNARRQTPVFLNEPTCILPNSFPEDYMTQTNPAIFSPRLEGVGDTDHFKRAFLDDSWRRASPHPAGADRSM